MLARNSRETSTVISSMDTIALSQKWATLCLLFAAYPYAAKTGTKATSLVEAVSRMYVHIALRLLLDTQLEKSNIPNKWKQHTYYTAYDALIHVCCKNRHKSSEDKSM